MAYLQAIIYLLFDDHIPDEAGRQDTIKKSTTLIIGKVHRASDNGPFLTSYILYTSGTVYLEVQFVAYGKYAFGHLWWMYDRWEMITYFVSNAIFLSQIYNASSKTSSNIWNW
jgi:hypothetical protein